LVFVSHRSNVCNRSVFDMLRNLAQHLEELVFKVDGRLCHLRARRSARHRLQFSDWLAIPRNDNSLALDNAIEQLRKITFVLGYRAVIHGQDIVTP
jgi:hypothetical protein